MDTDDWPQVQPLREVIADAERDLQALYAQRRAIILAMVDAKLTRRAIGARWGVSNVAITHIVNRVPPW